MDDAKGMPVFGQVFVVVHSSSFLSLQKHKLATKFPRSVAQKRNEELVRTSKPMEDTAFTLMDIIEHVFVPK